MSAFPKSLQDHPRLEQWLDLGTRGVVIARSGRVELGQQIDLAARRVVAAELGLDIGRVRLVQGDTRLSPDENYTAGSLSVQLGVLSLCAAARSLRALLLAEAARRLSGALDLQDGRVLCDGADSRLTIWDLAIDTARPVTEAPAAPADPAEPRRFAREAGARLQARMTGGAFIHDIVLPGMVHARVLALPHPRARLAGIDREAVLALDGVLDLYVDGSFAAVIAHTEARAMAAVARADALARWEIPTDGPQTADDLLAMADPEEILIEGAAQAAGNRRVAVSFAKGALAHASIGTCCALALWQDGRLTVHSHAQGAHQLRAGLAGALGLEESAIDVIHAPGAGCYGHNGADDVAFEAALLALVRPGVPVRLAWRREDELTRASLGPPMRSRAVIALAPDGSVAAMVLDVTSAPHQRRPGPGKPNFASGPLLAVPVPLSPATEPPASNGGGADRNGVPLYRTGALTLRRRVASGIPLRTSAMRALGAFANVAAIELAMEAAAEEAGEDPVAYRLRHLDDPRARAVIERVVALSGFTPEPGDDNAMGLGFARYKNKAGYCAVVVRIEAGELLRVPRLWAVADVGEAIDADGVIAQVEGGAIQALSWMLKEEAPIRGGAPAARDWEAYPILRFSEIPEIEVALLGTPADPPLGAGEIAQGPVAGAVATAVRRLFGLDHLASPLTPDRINALLNT